MAALQNGGAKFSNNLGRSGPHQPFALPERIVLRSVPEDDMESKITDLYTKFPDECKAITSPVANLYDYFDHYDQELHGAMFLRAVLEEICGRNLMRNQAILNFTQQWTRLNSTNVPYIFSLGLDTAFTADDIEHYGKDFLQDALRELQLLKLDHDEAVAMICERQNCPASNTSNQDPGSAQFPVLQHGPQVDPTLQRNFSDPTSLRLGGIPPKIPPSAPSASPMMNQGFPIRAPFPPPLQQFCPPKNEQSRPPHLSGQQYPSRRNDDDRRVPNVNLPRYGFPDMYYAVPPSAMMGQYPHYQVQPGPMRYNQPANRMQPFPKTKGPVYVGPSNDARILERQGVPRGRGSFGERNTFRGHPQSFGPQTPQSRQLPPSRQDQYSGSPQGSGPPVITPSSLSNELSATKPTRGSSFIPEDAPSEMHHTRRSSMPKALVEKSCGFSEEHTRPIPPLGSPHQIAARNHENLAPPGFPVPESMPPSMVQVASITDQMGSHPLRRFSNNMNPSRGVNPSTQYVGQHLNSDIGRGRPCPMEECPLSDRKLWIGGLPPATELPTLDQLLEPFGRYQLGKIMLSKTGNSDFGGFTFAEFQDPRDAARAVEALNGRDFDSLRCRLFLKPARINPKFNDPPNSAQKGVKLYTGRDKFNDMGNDHRRRVDDRGSFNQTMQTPYNQNQPTASRSQLGVYFHPSNVASALPSPPKDPSRKNHIINGTHGSGSTDGDVRDNKLNATAATLATNPVDPAPHDSTSFVKKKKGRMNKDGPPSDKEPQAKARKEMLSQLRTEKPNGAALKEGTNSTNLPKRQYNNNAPESSFSTSKKQAIPFHQETTESLGVSASDLKDELEQYVQPANGEPVEKLSRVHTASTLGRRLSSASLMISTDPTSYAQSERSGSGTDGVQTPDTPKDPAKMRQTSPALTESGLPSDHVSHPIATALDMAIPRSHSHPELLLPSMGSELKNKAGPIPLATESLDTVHIDQDPFPIGFAEKVNKDTDVESEEQHEAPSMGSAETPLPSGTKVDIFEKPDMKSSTAPFGGPSPKRAAAGPMQEMSPNTKLNPGPAPVFKRGLPRDLRTLVAVPKILPQMRPKARTGTSDADASIPAHKSASSIATLDRARGDEKKSDPGAKEQETSAHLTTVPSPDSVHERAAIPPISKQDEQALASLNINNDQPRTHVSGSQTKSETDGGGCSIASVSNSMATQEGTIIDSTTSIPRPSLADAADEDSHPPAPQPSVEQPVIQQKKRKTKKPKKPKKPKASQASSANSSSPTHSRSNTKEENKVPPVIPKAETPYLADDNTPLPQPAFVRQNHSSMRSRTAPIFKGQTQGSQNGDNSSVAKAPESNAINSSTPKAGSQPFYFFSKSPSNHDEVVVHGEPSNPQSSQDKMTQVKDQLQGEQDRCTISLDERQARLKVLEDHVQQNNLYPMKHLLQVLAEVAPRESEQATFGERTASKPRSEGSSETLSDIGQPRLFEITSDDEASSPFLPSAPPKEQDEPSVTRPSPVSCPADVPQTAPGPDAFRIFPDLEQPVDTDSGNQAGEDTTSSYPSTRNSSPERGRGCSTPPVRALGLPITHPASIKSENGSPSRKEPPKTPSWKEVATKPPTPSLQTGDIVEFIPRDTDGDTKGSQTSGVVRKSVGKDPWRVPSAEQPWGKNSKSKGKWTPESSKPKT